jgi:hypothetical protein
MFNTTIELELEHIDDNLETTKETVKVTLQETSPFVTGDIFADNISKKGVGYDAAGVVKDMVGTVIVSPKNIVDQIEKSDNAFVAIGKLFSEINNFCASPKRYVLLQKKSEQESSDLGQGDSQPDTDGSQTNGQE